jgi:NitT/TauT family transport system substrate-binding protein
MTNKKPLAFALILIAVVILGLLIWKSGYFGRSGDTVRINLTAPQTAFSIPTIIAAEKSFFKDSGVDVSVNYVNTGKIAMDDLLAGKANFANVVETNVAFAGFNNPKIKVVANIEKVYDATIVARKDKGIKSPADLKGKKIGVMLATTSQVFLDRFLEKNGIAKDSVQIVNLLPPAMQSGIIEGSGVDAISAWQPFVHNAEKALGDNAISFTDKDIFTGYMTLTGNSEFITNNPEATAGVLKAYIKAEQFLAGNKTESIDIVSRVLKLDKAVVERIWDQYEFRTSLNKELLDATTTEAKWIIATQTEFSAKQAPDYSVFFDSSYLRKIDDGRVK